MESLLFVAWMRWLLLSLLLPPSSKHIIRHIYSYTQIKIICYNLLKRDTCTDAEMADIVSAEEGPVTLSADDSNAESDGRDDTTLCGPEPADAESDSDQLVSEMLLRIGTYFHCIVVQLLVYCHTPFNFPYRSRN